MPSSLAEPFFSAGREGATLALPPLTAGPGLSVSTEVQFRPYRTDDFITRLYYETPRFTVLNQTWVLKARVNDSERNPNLSCKRTLSFQLLLKSKVTAPLECSFLLLKGPYDDVKISPVIYHFVFTNEIETNRDHSVIFEISSKYCILDSFVDHDGYSISSKGFSPTVVDVIVI